MFISNVFTIIASADSEKAKILNFKEKTMNKTKFSNVVLRLVCLMLIAAISIGIVGCQNKDVVITDDGSEAKVLGVGALQFNFNVVDGEGKVTKYVINTDKTVVGQALLDLQLIEGDEGEFGLYVKKVNGIEADYDKTGTYWAFYENGAYAAKGVDQTTVEIGTTYEFRVEK